MLAPVPVPVVVTVAVFFPKTGFPVKSATKPLIRFNSGVELVGTSNLQPNDKSK